MQSASLSSGGEAFVACLIVADVLGYGAHNITDPCQMHNRIGLIAGGDSRLQG